MGALIRARDWAATPLGPIGAWPQSLTTAAGTMLKVPQPMWLAWGPDLIQLYNDAYVTVLDAERHPNILGRPAMESWADVWPLIGPDLQAIMDGGPAVSYADRPVRVRRGEVREQYFTYSYSPIPDPAAPHGVGGVLCLGTETTAAMSLRSSEERQAFLLALSDALRLLADPVAIQGTACRVLGEHLGADRTYYALVDWVRGLAVIERDYVRGAAPSVVGEHPMAAFAGLEAAYRTGERLVVHDVEDTAALPEADLAPYRVLAVRSLVSTPLVKDGLTVASMSVLKGEQHHWTDQEIALVEDAGERTWAAVERARAEAALRESEERFRALVEPFAQATWEADGAGQVVTDSPSWRAYTGQTVEQWLGEGWAQAVHPDDQTYALHQWQDAVRSGTLVNAEYRLRSPNGSWRWTNARAAPLHNVDATVRKWVGMNVDVTERRTAETALLAERQRLAVAEAVAAERRALLKRIVRAQEEERAKVAHEVHDSLTQLAHAAAMYLDNALELMTGADEPARVDVERGRDLTRQAANEARRLIAGLRPETLELIGLGGVLRQEVALLRAAGWQAELDDGDLTGLQIGGEAEITLYRVVQEALTNVRKHAWRARIRVLLKRLPHGVLLEVRDWGRGFDPGAVRATARGEHVGLTSMRERIELLGGTFQVSSRPNQGTIVRAILPVPVLVEA